MADMLLGETSRDREIARGAQLEPRTQGLHFRLVVNQPQDDLMKSVFKKYLLKEDEAARSSGRHGNHKAFLAPFPARAQ